MKLNLLEIGVLIVLLILIISGFRQGLIKKLTAVITLVLSIVLVSLVLPYMTDFLKNSTPVYDYIVEQCDQIVSEQVASSLTDGMQTEVPDTLTLSDDEQETVISGLPLPETLKNQILKYNNTDGYRSLHVSTFQDYIINYIASAVLNVIAFLLAIILVQVLIRVILRVLKVLTHVPGLSFVNRLAGGAAGILQWFFLMWLFFLVLSICQATSVGQYLLKMVWESEFLNLLYDCNFFVQIVLRAAAIFA